MINISKNYQNILISLALRAGSQDSDWVRWKDKDDFSDFNCVCNICGKEFNIWSAEEHGMSHISTLNIKAFL